MTDNILNFTGWFLSIFTATGNGLVVFLITKTRNLHSPANWFVVSLAVADFTVGAVLFPSGYYCVNTTHCNRIVMIFRMALYWFVMHASVTNLCALTWNRYLAIVHPFKYNTSMTVKRPRMTILVAWLIPLAVSLALVLGMFATSSTTVHKIMRLTCVSAFYIILCMFLLYAVVRILLVARAQSRQKSLMERQLRSNFGLTLRRSNKNETAAGFIIAVNVFFLGCHTVVNYLIVCLTIPSCNVSDRAGQVVSLLLVLNSMVNPMVYALLKKDIKKKIKILICAKTFGEKRNHGENE